MKKQPALRKNIYIRKPSVREWLSQQENASSEIERFILDEINNASREQRENILTLLEMAKENRADMKKLLENKE